MKNIFYSHIISLAYRCNAKRRREKHDGYGIYYIKKLNKQGANFVEDSLTKEEKAAIVKIWGEDGRKSTSFSFYKQFCGYFNPEFVPDVYYHYAEDVLNLRWAAYFLQHKCNLKFFIPEANRAEVILQKIDGHILVDDNVDVSELDAINKLMQYPTFVYKIARGTGGGKGVRKISLDDIKDKDAYFAELLSPTDIEVEKIVRQNNWMAQFNPDSVNTIRLLTLNINGKCTVLSSFLRMGAKGSFVDNLSGGHGVLVGINSEGNLNEFGINSGMERRYQSPTGVSFKGMSIPDFESIKQKIVDFHKKIPYANLIGWDVAIDENNTPIILEINLDDAAIVAHQAFNGPIFGERLSEVQEYIEKRKSSLRNRIMLF